MGGFLYVCSVAVLICLAVPRQLLSFAGGYAFGPLFGAVFATLGVTLGCVLAFGMSRYYLTGVTILVTVVTEVVVTLT